MQGLTDGPRSGLTADQVRWLLAHGPQVQVDQGCDLLDTSNNVVADISADMVAGGEVTGDNTVTGESIAGKCQIKLMRELVWGRDRVRPWVSLSDGGTTITRSTVVTAPASTLSRVDDTGTEWAQGTLTNTEASGAALRLKATTSTTYAAAVLTDAPKAYYRLGESSGTTATDSSGNALNGTYTAVTLGTTGLLAGDSDKAATFNGTSSRALLPGLLNPASTPFTIEAWVQLSSLSSNQQLVSQADGTGTGQGLLWYYAAGGKFATSLGGGTVSSTFSPVAGTTYHVVFTYTGTTYTFYVNGAAAGSGTLAAQAATGAWSLGTNKTSSGGWLGGVLDEVAIYDHVLTATRVTAHYNAGRTAPTTTYATSGTRVSPALSLASLAYVDSSTVSWSASVPSGGSVAVEISTDGGTTWHAVTSGAAVPGAAPGASVLSRVTLIGNGSTTPTVSSLSVSASQVERTATVETEAPNLARFYQGVYVLTTPQQPSGETPATYDVQGYDLTSILTDQVGDTYVVAAGTTYLTALRAVLAASGVGAPLLLAGDAGSTALPYTMVWALYDGGPSWLTICADLLASIGYERLWADEVGNLRSQPITDPATRALAWTFDVTDGSTDSLVSPGWTRDADLWAAPNKWIFIRSNTGGTSPTVANGMVYKVTNQSDGPSSVDALSGRVRTKVVYLDVPDAATLKTQGDLAVAADKAASVSVSLQTFLPAIGHGDVVQFVQPSRSEKLGVASWTTMLDGSQGAWTLGLPATQPDAPLSASGYATVTQASPLRIVMDGATQDSPANSLDGAAYAVGNRVTCTVRSPVPPLVQGVESPTA